MNESSEGFSRKHREGIFSAISAGFFFVVVGAIFLTTPNLFEKIVDFFKDFDIVRVPNLGFYLPAPVRPLFHSDVYLAVERFGFIWGLFQIAILVLRLGVRSPLSKDAETVSNIIFWLGTSFLIRTFLIETIRFPLITGLTRWFVFWAALIMLLGLALIVRAIILAAGSIRTIRTVT